MVDILTMYRSVGTSRYWRWEKQKRDVGYVQSGSSKIFRPPFPLRSTIAMQISYPIIYFTIGSHFMLENIMSLK